MNKEKTADHSLTKMPKTKLSKATKISISLAEFKRLKEIETLYNEIQEKGEVSEDGGHMGGFSHIGYELEYILEGEEMEWGFFKPKQGNYTKIYIYDKVEEGEDDLKKFKYLDRIHKINGEWKQYLGAGHYCDPELKEEEGSN